MNTETNILTKEVEVEYFTKYKEAIDAGNTSTANFYRDLIFQKNQRLVASIAKKYSGRGLDIEDIKQEGSMGLLKAIEKFDVTLGNRFSTYATNWIKQSIELAFYYQHDAIRVPVYLKKILNNLYKVKGKLTSLLGREPSTLELANELGETEEKVIEYLSFNNDVMSLDRNIKDDEDGTMIELVNSNTLDPMEKYEAKSTFELVKTLVSDLPEKEQFVIKKRFGLNNEQTLTLEQIGKALNVSHERVRQIERKALSMLRERAISSQISLGF